DKSKKRLKGIYEIRFNRYDHKISIHQICKYDYSSDSWQFKYDIGDDKKEIGHEENKKALTVFENELKKMEQMYPYKNYMVYEPRYDNLRGVDK
ncbi:hypothetical protein, partial [Vallitalea guaymasensis]|uniref:hypothetical protein n=1 Tax=Vallitalea guaymasensis TaxID=1185412 RepID=UPI002F41D1A1